MTNVEIGLLVTGCGVAITLYTSINLLRKNEKLLQIINNNITAESVLAQIQEDIIDSDNKLKEIDAKGSFKSDDEVGFFFTTLLNIQTKLNEYKS